MVFRRGLVPKWVAPNGSFVPDPINVAIVTPAIANYARWSELKNTVITDEALAVTALMLELNGPARPLLLYRIKYRHDMLRRKREEAETRHELEAHGKTDRTEVKRLGRAGRRAVQKVHQSRA